MESITVGTTSVRTLESLCRYRRPYHHNPDATQDELHVQQWMPYEDKNDLTPVEALQTDSGLSEPTRNGSVV